MAGALDLLELHSSLGNILHAIEKEKILNVHKSMKMLFCCCHQQVDTKLKRKKSASYGLSRDPRLAPSKLSREKGVRELSHFPGNTAGLPGGWTSGQVSKNQHPGGLEKGLKGKRRF